MPIVTLRNIHKSFGQEVVFDGLSVSFYPKEGEPLWSKYSTHAVCHALEVYSKFTFAYPYPVMISVNGPIGGMEYPMITFNGGRPEKDGTYTKRKKYGLISVIIHEVGHTWFPMVVNSDERQWTWMDEGLNTFVQYLAEQEWEEDYPSRRGEPKDMIEYMTSARQVPIMTNSESLLQFGNNAYGKPATALNVLRETVLGRELFDFAFKEYANRWKFKRPTPADLFRTLEDVSAVDLDWFFTGWFYTTDHTDIAITGLRLMTIDTGNPDAEKPRQKEKRDKEPKTLAQQRNKPLPKRDDKFKELRDFYTDFDKLDVTEGDRKKYQKYLKGLKDKEKKVLDNKHNFYVVDLANLGGLVMPVILKIDFTDGSSQELRVPAEIWRLNSERVSKNIITEKKIKSLTLDPHLETADADRSNNHFPPEVPETRFEVKKEKKERNAMQKARGDDDDEEEDEDEDKDEDEDEDEDKDEDEDEDKDEDEDEDEDEDKDEDEDEDED